MAYNRSQVTENIAAMLTDEPQTIADFVRVLGITIQSAQNSVHTLLKSGECWEVQIMGNYGKMVRGFKKPRAKVHIPVEREEYTGERLPSRYVPRTETALTLGGFGWVNE